MHLAKLEGPVDHRIEHGVGHPYEEKPQHGLRLYLLPLEKRHRDEDDVIRSPADNEGKNDNYGHP